MATNASGGGPYAFGSTATVSFTVVAAQTLASIAINPNTSTIVDEGGQKSFTATGYDASGNVMSPEPSFTWSPSANMSGTGQTSTFNAPGSAGTFYVSASSGGISSSATQVTVTAPTVGTITISPSPTTTVQEGHTTTFSATATDTSGAPMSPAPTFTWNPSAEINSSGLFTAPSSPGYISVYASSGGQTSPTTVVTVPTPVLTTIVVSPAATVTVGTNAQKQFSAVGKDQFGNTMSPAPTFTWTSGGGTISSSGLYTAGSSAGGPYTITAKSGSVSGTSQVTVSMEASVTPGQTTPAQGVNCPFWCKGAPSPGGGGSSSCGAASGTLDLTFGTAYMQWSDPVATRGFPLTFDVFVNSLPVETNRPLGNASFTYDAHVTTQTIYNSSQVGSTHWMVVDGNGTRLDFGLASSAPAATSGIYSLLTVQKNGSGVTTGYDLASAAALEDLHDYGAFDYKFDALGRLLTVTDPDGNKQVVSYGSAGPVSVTDLSTGKYLSFIYGTGSNGVGPNQIATVQEGGLEYTQFGYGYPGTYLTSIATETTNSSQNTSGNQLPSVQYTYNSSGTINTVQKDNDSSTLRTFGYTSVPSSNPSSPSTSVVQTVTDSYGSTDNVAYVGQTPFGTPPAGLAQVTTYQNAEGGVIEDDFDSNSNLLREVLPAPNGAGSQVVVSYTYDSNHNALSRTDSMGTTGYTYSNGRLSTTTDPLGHVWTTTYSGANVQTVSDAVSSETLSYADGSQPFVATGLQDANGNVWSFSHNNFGQPTGATPPTGSPTGPTTMTYDEAAGDSGFGYLASVTDGNGNLTTIDSYDGTGTSVSAIGQDLGFETPAITTSPYWFYNCTGSPWTFAGTSGISLNGSASTAGNPNAPQGVQVANLVDSGNISQPMTFPGGYCEIVLQSAQCAHSASVQSFSVQIDGAAVCTLTPTGTSYGTYTTSAFPVSAGTHTLAFQGLDAQGTGSAVFIDNVKIYAVPADGQDLGFENETIPSPYWEYNPAGSGWTWTTTAGVSVNASASTSGNPNAPEGRQVANLVDSGTFSQSMVFTGAPCVVSFWTAQSAYSHGVQSFSVLLDGAVLGTYKPTGTVYAPCSTPAFSPSAGTHTLEFEGLNPAGTASAVFIDDVFLGTPSNSGLGDPTSVSTYPVAGSVSVRHTTTTQWDASQRPLFVTNPDGSVLQKGYDGRNLYETVDEGGNDWFDTWCTCGLPTGVQGPAVGGSNDWFESVGLNSDHQTTSFEDADSHTTQYGYGPAGELDTVTYPDGDRTSLLYDTADVVRGTVDGRGQEIDYGYDAAARVTSVTHATTGQATEGYSYYADDTPHVATDSSGTATYVYNADKSVQSATYNYAANGLTAAQEIEYTYYPDGLTHTVTWLSGSTNEGTWTYGYDAGGRLVSVSNPFGENTGWQYDGEDKLASQTNANGTTTGWAYADARGWPTAITQTSRGAAFETYALSYDGLPYGSTAAAKTGLLTQCAETYVPVGGGSSSTNTSTYGYDALSRLTSYVRVGGNAANTSYVYDLAGNYEAGGPFTYDAANKLTSYTTGGTTYPYSYDADGDAAFGSLVPNWWYGGAWSDEGRLTAISFSTTNSSPTVPTVNYVYGSDGLRRAMCPGSSFVPANATYYVYAGDTLIGEVNSAGTPIATYTWGAAGLVSEHLGSGSSSANSLWYHYGPQGETRVLTNSSGSLADYYLYNPWGLLVTSGGSDRNPFQYGGSVGYYTDSNAKGLVLCGQRWYSPAYARWLSRDPISFDGGADLYVYCGDDPVGLVDPSGLQGLSSVTTPQGASEAASIEAETGPGEPLPPSVQNGINTAVKRINNIINKPDLESDIQGAQRETCGNSGIKDNGTPFDHQQELNNSLRGLRNRSDYLSRFNQPEANAAREKSLTLIQRIEEMFKGLGI